MTALCPLEVHAAIERRCAAARSGRLKPYSGMLRASVLDVVTSMFPRFAARRGEKALAEDVDDFVRNFGAARAQFMHISTEFVRFSEGRFEDPVARTLLEYEWTLFSVEVSEERVGAPPEGWGARCLADVSLNPTLQLIAVPFDLDADDAEADRMVGDGRSPFVYAVYRTHDHRVLTQGLNGVDVSVLRELADGVGQTGSDNHSAWIGNALRLGLVVARHT
jgi:hypothetical protein